MATEGHSTTCGAVLIARQASPEQIAAAPKMLDGSGFDERVRFQTPEGRSLANRAYVLTLADGQKINGRTNEDGLSDRIFTVGKTSIVEVTFDLDADARERGHD